jgi:hypothetical protein
MDSGGKLLAMSGGRRGTGQQIVKKKLPQSKRAALPVVTRDRLGLSPKCTLPGCCVLQKSPLARVLPAHPLGTMIQMREPTTKRQPRELRAGFLRQRQQPRWTPPVCVSAQMAMSPLRQPQSMKVLRMCSLAGRRAQGEPLVALSSGHGQSSMLPGLHLPPLLPHPSLKLSHSGLLLFLHLLHVLSPRPNLTIFSINTTLACCPSLI